MTMFYLCFGATGGAFAVDALFKRRRHGDKSVDDNWSWGTTVATRLIQVHLALIHFGMAVSQLAAQNTKHQSHLVARPRAVGFCRQSG